MPGAWPHAYPIDFRRDVAKLVKARGFDPRIRRFESCRPCHFLAMIRPLRVHS
jgi:hypothetical protein